MLFKKKNTEIDLSSLDMKKVVSDAKLQHIAFIMDGNGRWVLHLYHRSRFVLVFPDR